MDEKRQVQKELFEEFGTAPKRRHPKNIFQQKQKAAVTFSLEHLIFITIGIIILALIAFSLGVERGKSVTLRDRRVEGAKAPGPSKEDTGLNSAAPEEERSGIEYEAAEKPVLDYTVQVASYVSRGTAESRAGELKSKGYEAFVLHKGSYYVMCIGRFPDRQSANAERDSLRKEYSDCLVRKID